MALEPLLADVAKRPGMFFYPVEFDVAVAFVQGFDIAKSGGVLMGMREWLIVKLGYGNNLAWGELLLRLLFPEAEKPRELLVHSENQKHAVQFLFKTVDEFWQERESPDGLRRIYLNYQDWLRHQEWYGPNSPHYVAVSDKS